MKLKFSKDFSSRIKSGTVVEVDKMVYARDSRSGLLVRVVGIWKTPKWLDIGWFEIGTRVQKFFCAECKKMKENKDE